MTTKPMITELTTEQQERLAVYRDKWIKIGLSTEPSNRPAAEEAVKRAYEVAGLTPPTEFIWVRSPKEAVNYLSSRFPDQDKKNFINTMCYGNQDASLLSFYDYFLEVCDVQEAAALKPLIDLAQHCGWWSPYSDFAVLQEKPTKISMVSERLHNEKGPAIEYADGFKVYSLRGIRVPAWVVETPVEQMDASKVLEIVDVDVRREAMRRMGLDRLFNKLDKKTVHEDKGYELVDLKLSEEYTGRFLKMSNPSIEAVHVEGVPNDCKTVDEALAFRNKQILDKINGGNWTPPVKLT